MLNVKITQVQREYLEFLVNRRLADLRLERKANAGLAPSEGFSGKPSIQELVFEDIKVALTEARS